MTLQKNEPNHWVTLALVIIIVAGIVLFIRYTMNQTTAEPEVKIENDSLIITGMYGTSYPLSNVAELTLLDETPVLGKKISGAGLTRQQAYRGLYQVEGIGPCRVFLFGDSGPTIQIQTDEEIVLIKYSDPQKTLSLMNDLMLTLSSGGTSQ